jgi:glycosyltransferase involved in cell wall biosynthesis
MAKVAVFHPGVQHSWQTALALQQLGLLEWYATTILYQPGRWPYRLERIPGPVGRKLHSEFMRFSPPPLDPALVRTDGLFEWAERIAYRAGFRQLAERLDTIGNARFGKGLGKAIAASDAFALWGFNNSSADAFRIAKAHGRRCILDQTIGHRRYYDRIVAEQYALYPQYFEAAPNVSDDSVAERNDEELALADTVVVGSPFCGQTVVDYARVEGMADKIRVLPYCFNPASFSLPLRPPRARTEPLRFLFVGQIGVRKGAHLLLEAFSQIPPEKATLTMVGKVELPAAAFARHAGHVTHRPTVPRQEVAGIMAAHDVLVLPSFYEGSALVLLEGLASHMGLIQTRAAGNGATLATGLLLGEPTPESLREALWEAIDHRDRVEEWRAAARAEAGRYAFENYRAGIAEVVADS